jgi:hypothetical protein
MTQSSLSAFRYLPAVKLDGFPPDLEMPEVNMLLVG